MLFRFIEGQTHLGMPRRAKWVSPSMDERKVVLHLYSNTKTKCPPQMGMIDFVCKTTNEKS